MVDRRGFLETANQDWLLSPPKPGTFVVVRFPIRLGAAVLVVEEPNFEGSPGAGCDPGRHKDDIALTIMSLRLGIFTFGATIIFPSCEEFLGNLLLVRTFWGRSTFTTTFSVAVRVFGPPFCLDLLCWLFCFVGIAFEHRSNIGFVLSAFSYFGVLCLSVGVTPAL